MGSRALVQKPHLARGKTVCSGKRKGGLGIRCLLVMNKALLCKWSWCFSNERGAFWKQAISQKYGGDEGGWRFCEVGDGHDVGI